MAKMFIHHGCFHQLNLLMKKVKMVITAAQENPTPFLHMLHMKTEQDFNSYSWPSFEKCGIGKKLLATIGPNSKHNQGDKSQWV